MGKYEVAFSLLWITSIAETFSGRPEGTYQSAWEGAEVKVSRVAATRGAILPSHHDDSLSLGDGTGLGGTRPPAGLVGIDIR
jgi:hypothetical protein